MVKVILNFILLLSVCATNAQIQTSKRQKPVVVEAESGKLSRDVEVLNEGKIRYIFPKTNWESWDVPRDSNSMITYQIKFKTPGYYNLYARVKVGPATRKDDSFFAAKGFGLKEIKKENWICVNELYCWGYTSKDSIVAKSGVAESGVWKWINVTQGFCTPAESNRIFYVSKANQTVTFQLATREDGLCIDKFAFGFVGYNYTVAQLDNRQVGSSQKIDNLHNHSSVH